MTNEEMCQNIKSFTVGLDDTFAFHCTQCGKCCIHRTDIILSPRDIFKMAKELKLSNSDFLRKYCSMHIGPTSRMSLWITVRIALYEDYSFTEEFLPQFEANVAAITELVDDIPGLKELLE